MAYLYLPCHGMWRAWLLFLLKKRAKAMPPWQETPLSVARNCCSIATSGPLPSLFPTVGVVHQGGHCAITMLYNYVVKLKELQQHLSSVIQTKCQSSCQE